MISVPTNERTPLPAFRAHITAARSLPWGGLLVVLFLLQGWSHSLSKADETTAVRVFDTRTTSRAPLSSEAIRNRRDWTLVPEDTTAHKFKGDLVLLNRKLAVVLRRSGRGAEVYTLEANGATLRAELVALGSDPSAALAAVKIVENTADTASVDASFKTPKGERLTLGYELKQGQVFVQTQRRSGATGLLVNAPCRFAVLPDFFADDMVVDATQLMVPQTELPSENFLLHMLGDGEAILMAEWYPAKDDVRIMLSGQQQDRRITSSEIHYAPEGKICVAILSAPGIWHRRDILQGDANRILHLGWKAPYAAHWRVDWQRDDKLTDSWEMLTQKPDGEYVKHGWYGQSESFGNIDWLKDGRQRWTTVLGSFLYPCWVDKNGEGYLQPLKERVRFEGPALIYPINRLEATPLEQFTVVDIMRATMGVGPCEYILDVEGQKKTFQGRPTCASRTILDNIYASKAQKEKREEVQRTLDEVIAFVRHIRGRINDYAAFGHEMVAWLEQQKAAHPELAGILNEMQDTTHKIDGFIDRRKEGIKTPEYATRLVDEFRSTLVDYEGADALAKCKKITAALVDIGGNQDELVGECRMVVKILRQKAALAMASDPRTANVAREVRRRTQQMLRNPTSYEAPRH
jgi:hypothetical protein